MKRALSLALLGVLAACGKYRDGYLGADIVRDGGAPREGGEAGHMPDDDDHEDDDDERDELP
jgi:hypothetical protein